MHWLACIGLLLATLCSFIYAGRRDGSMLRLEEYILTPNHGEGYLCEDMFWPVLNYD